MINKIYFETRNGILYNVNCFDLFSKLDTKFDLVILDPNFEIWNDVLVNIKDIINLMNANSYLLTFSRQPYTSFILLELSKHLIFRDEIIWHDPQPIWVSNNLPLRVHENILIFMKGKKKGNFFVLDNPNKDLKAINKGKLEIAKWKTNSKRTYKPKDKKMLISLLKFSRNLRNPLGRISKPINLFEILIKCFSNENDLILDCFAGSGTSLFVSEMLSRRWIGIEKEIKHCKFIKDNLSKVSNKLI